MFDHRDWPVMKTTLRRTGAMAWCTSLTRAVARARARVKEVRGRQDPWKARSCHVR